MSSNLQKVMLAAKPKPEELDEVLDNLPYPMLFSPKLDGIRVTVQDGRLWSRELKLIPNTRLQKRWGRRELNGLDGEIVVGDPTDPLCFPKTSSVVMSRGKPVEGAVFNVFDDLCDVEPFEIRHCNAGLIVERFYGVPDGFNAASKTLAARDLKIVPHTLIKNRAALDKYEAKHTGAGFEGVMGRLPHGGYKHGRSTLKEGGLVAVKRFVDAEALITAAYEQEANTNAAAKSATGAMRRPSHKAGKVGKDTLGGFTVRVANGALKGAVLNVGTGTGLTDAERKRLWVVRDSLPGKYIKVRYQHMGSKAAPRIPTYQGFRDKKDFAL